MDMYAHNPIFQHNPQTRKVQISTNVNLYHKSCRQTIYTVYAMFQTDLLNRWEYSKKY